MKSFKFLLLLGGLFTAAAQAQTPDFAPASFSSVIFNATLTAATGGANGAGTFSSLFTSEGTELSLNANGTLTDPVPFIYTKTGSSTARIAEGANGVSPPVSVALTFSSATAGTFVATYGNGATQSGSFTLVPIGFASPLVNVSTRTTLAANGTAIIGFVVGGSGPRRVLIRAVGPGLGQFGVANALNNPQVSLFRATTVIGFNDDFGSGPNLDPTLPQQFTRVGAFGLAAGSRDSALVATLEPGPYTAQIRGGTATEAGEVLLEVYFLD